jgi:patatin-like phospholipase/acyl hydrolase
MAPARGTVAKYRILTFDGGGIRGVLTARLLEQLNQARPNFLEQTHLFAGTSTGSFIAISLAKNVSPTELVAVYRKQGPHVFHRDVLHDLGSLWGFRRARYQTKPRYEALHPTIGDITLNDLLPKHVLVASFQLDWNNEFDPLPKKPPRTWKAKFWHNYEGNDSDGAQKAIEVIMRSSAAPSYFPIYEGYVDGGVVANNPSLCALAQAINQDTGGKQDIQDVVLMSFGTATKMTNITSRNGDWGIEEWGFNLIDLLLESGSGLADYQCRQLLGDRYIRLNPDLKESVGLDAVDHIDMLLTQADGFDLTPALAFIDGPWQ